MGITRGGKLVADIAEVVSLTMQANLSRLEGSGEITLDPNGLVSANDEVYDRLVAAGYRQPEQISNQDVLKRAVAYTLLRKLAVLGYLSAGGETPTEAAARFETEVERHLRFVRPQTNDGPEPRKPGEGRPVVLNQTERGFFTGR